MRTVRFGLWRVLVWFVMSSYNTILWQWRNSNRTKVWIPKEQRTCASAVLYDFLGFTVKSRVVCSVHLFTYLFIFNKTSSNCDFIVSDGILLHHSCILLSQVRTMFVYIHQHPCARHVTLCTILATSPLHVNNNSNKMVIHNPHCSWAGYQTPHCDATHGKLRNPAHGWHILLSTCKCSN